MEGEEPSQEAAYIFRDHIISEVSVENQQLREENGRLQPILDYLQTMEILLGDGEVITTTLGQGDVVESNPRDGGASIAPLKFWSIPIRAATQPLANYGMRGGGITISMSGRQLGCFPVPAIFRGGGEPIRLHTTTDADDAIYLSFYVNESTLILGAVENLCEEDLGKFKAKEYQRGQFMAYLMMGHGLSSPNVTFTPQFVNMIITPRLQTTLSLITATRQDPMPSDSSLPSDDLRKLVVAALCENNQADVLTENRMLKLENKVLTDARTWVQTVDICHPNGSYRFTLDEGKSVEVGEGALTLWRIELPMEEQLCVAVEDLFSLQIRLSGLRVHEMGGPLRGNGGHYNILAGEEGDIVGLRIPYGSNVFVIGFFNWDEFSATEVESILENFSARIYQAFVGSSDGSDWQLLVGDNPVGRFPAAFKLSLRLIEFDPSSIESVLSKINYNRSATSIVEEPEVD